MLTEAESNTPSVPLSERFSTPQHMPVREICENQELNEYISYSTLRDSPPPKDARQGDLWKLRIKHVCIIFQPQGGGGQWNEHDNEKGLEG